MRRERTYKQVETAKKRAELAAANLRDDEDRADDFADMSVEEYADLRGITIKNPIMEGDNMAKISLSEQVKTLKTELAEANEQLAEAHERIEELEDERADVIDALGLEVEEEEDEDEEEEEEDEDEEDDD